MKIVKKVQQEYFEEVLKGKKRFEVRLADFECKPLLLGILVVILLYGCKTQNSEVFVEETKTYADPSVTIKVQREENFQIALASNPTTGYGWEFETNPNLISLINQTFKPESDLIGAGGTETFKFSALNEGEAKIVFSYKRSWEEEVIEKKVFQVKIQ